MLSREKPLKPLKPLKNTQIPSAVVIHSAQRGLDSVTSVALSCMVLNGFLGKRNFL